MTTKTAPAQPSQTAKAVAAELAAEHAQALKTLTAAASAVAYVFTSGALFALSMAAVTFLSK